VRLKIDQVSLEIKTSKEFEISKGLGLNALRKAEQVKIYLELKDLMEERTQFMDTAKEGIQCWTNGIGH